MAGARRTPGASRAKRGPEPKAAGSNACACPGPIAKLQGTGPRCSLTVQHVAHAVGLINGAKQAQHVVKPIVHEGDLLGCIGEYLGE